MNHHQTAFSNKGNLYFSDSYTYAGKNDTKTSIRLTSYNTQIMETAIINPEEPSFKPFIKDNCINWFRVQGLCNATDISRILVEFGMHNLDIRDILTPNHIVKIDDYDKHILVILNSCVFEARNNIHSEHISIIVTDNVVITFTESNNNLFGNIQVSLETNALKIREQKSGMLLVFLLNSIMAEMIETASKVENMLEEIEYILLNNQGRTGNVSYRIQQCRHAHLIIRKNTYPLKEEFPVLLKARNEIIDQSLLMMFNELSDQLEYIIQTTTNSKDLLSSLVELYVSNSDFKMNLVMKRLTVVSTLFIPITFLVGVWGMNFAVMPELKWKYGYIFAWCSLLITSIGTWLFMKKKKWF